MLDRLQRWLGSFRHAQLLGALALLIVAHPFLDSGRIGSVTLDLLLLVTLLSTVVACSSTRLNLIVGLSLTLLMQASAWYRGFLAGEPLLATSAQPVLGLVFFAYFGWLVLSDVFRARTVSLDTICGALAVYLLMGVWWAFAYALLENLIPGSIVGLRPFEQQGGYVQFLTYSFVTLTTLGYGNVVPGNNEADVLASAEAIVGQIYMTVLIARLVAMNLASGAGGDSTGEDIRP